MKNAAISVVAVCIALAAVLAATTKQADATEQPFSPVPAVGNIAALDSAPVFSVPQSLPADFAPAPGSARALGDAGYIWRDEQSGVCVLTPSGGGCLAEFVKPIMLYLSGGQKNDGTYLSGRADAVVPDSVAGITLVLDNNVRVPTSIAGNSLGVSIPAGHGVSGYDVALRDGTSFHFEDVVRVPDVAEQLTAGG